ncbi:unnamed protein product [Ascophyllum nodosum]
MVRKGLRRVLRGEKTMENKDPTKDAGRIPKRRAEGAVRAPKRGRIGNTDRHAAFAEDVRREATDPYHLRDSYHFPRCFREGEPA